MQRQMTISDALDLANRYREEGQFVAAEQICRNVLDARPNCCQAWEQLGEVHMIPGRWPTPSIPSPSFAASSNRSMSESAPTSSQLQYVNVSCPGPPSLPLTFSPSPPPPPPGVPPTCPSVVKPPLPPLPPSALGAVPPVVPLAFAPLPLTAPLDPPPPPVVVPAVAPLPPVNVTANLGDTLDSLVTRSAVGTGYSYAPFPPLAKAKVPVSPLPCGVK